MPNPTVEVKLEDVLAKIDSRLERLEMGQADIKEAVNKVQGTVSGIDKRLDNLEGRVNSLTGWLIGILFVLVGGLLGLLGKIAFFPPA